MRKEKDVLGVVEVPDNRFWGAQTQRCLNFFDIGTQTMPFGVVRALAIIKKAAAKTNVHFGLLDQEIAQAIDQAAQDVMDGKYNDEFPIPPWQTGSGTHSNMNANEVIANIANKNLGHPIGQKHPVHPNDHVNLSQSSNDTFPTAMHIAFVQEVHQRLLPSLETLIGQLRLKQKTYEKTIKLGRTHFQDATPMYAGQEIGAWASQIELAYKRIKSGLQAVYELAQGGTAVGSGLNTPVGFDTLVCQHIADITGLAFVSNPDKFAGLSGHDALVGASGDLNQLASTLLKLSNDMKILASGPRAGLAELVIPPNEPGSSIMPGKINPTQAEALGMVACQVMGNHVAVSMAGSQGQLQLNVFKPVIILNLLQSIELLSDSITCFTKYCLAGMTYDVERLKEFQDRSLMLVTALAPHIGYDKCAEIARKAHHDKSTLKEAALSLGYISAEDYDRIVRAEYMLSPFETEEQ